MKRKVKIAVVDTGIDKNHNYLSNDVFGGVGFESKDDYIFISDKYQDDNGHGTSCASIIKKEFKNVEFFIVKALDKLGRTNVQVLEEALKYLLNIDVKIINLSLSIMESTIVDDLYKICEELNKQGKIIICSVANGFEWSYPAKFDNVIGVKGFILEDNNSYWYNKGYEIQCIMDNNSYLTCDLNNSYKLFGKCNSQAAARLTGKIAEIAYENYNIRLDDIEQKLEKNTMRSYWTSKDLEASKRYPKFKDKESIINKYIIKDIIEIIIESFGLDEENKEWHEYSLFNKHIGLNSDNCFKLIQKIENKFSINLNYMEISRYDFISVYTLSELVENNLNKVEIL